MIIMHWSLVFISFRLVLINCLIGQTHDSIVSSEIVELHILYNLLIRIMCLVVIPQDIPYNIFKLVCDYRNGRFFVARSRKTSLVLYIKCFTRGDLWCFIVLHFCCCCFPLYLHLYNYKYVDLSFCCLPENCSWPHRWCND